MADRRIANLKQADLTRYAKALDAAGVREWRVIVRPNGTHEIVVGGAIPEGSDAALRRALDAATGAV
jgi:hypothetical protein